MKINEILILALLLLSSCLTQKRIDYLQVKKTLVEYNRPPLQVYKIRPFDELYIQVSSLDEATTTFIKNRNEMVGQMSQFSASLISFPVDKDGYINFSFIGKVFVKDLTTVEIEETLKSSLTGILNQPVVSVKLLSKRFAILGYVKNPGNYYYTQDKLSIFDAISMAGDALEYANKQGIVLVREIDGKIVRKEINLEKADILESEDFYIKPNDLIVIKSLKQRFWGLREFPYAIILSSITTGLLIYNLVK
ncbi:MAG: polysaccharide biosynthesis/export family protein [Bacteroidota bacterium]|nr:polysaccharide biosynthesis/export family protein [Bacteroidota bacterium]